MTSPTIQSHPVTVKPSFLDKPIHRGFLKYLLESIEVMRPTDIEAVVAIHETEIPEGVFTELGREFLTLFYRQVINSSYATGYVVKKNGRVVGYIAGSSDAGEFFKELFRRYFFSTGLIVFKRIMIQPAFLPRLIKRVFMNRHKEKCAESLAGAVLKEYQGNGYGLVLLKKLIDELRRAGLDRIQCVVVEDAKNPATVKLHRMYQRGGYVQIGAYHIGHVRYIRYLRRL